MLHIPIAHTPLAAQQDACAAHWYGQHHAQRPTHQFTHSCLVLCSMTSSSPQQQSSKLVILAERSQPIKCAALNQHAAR